MISDNIPCNKEKAIDLLNVSIQNGLAFKRAKYLIDFSDFLKFSKMLINQRFDLTFDDFYFYLLL